MPSQSIRRVVVASLIALASVGVARAHGGHAGDIEIVHPFATPTPPGAVNGAAYIAELQNGGKQADKLLRASTPAAERAELHAMTMDNGVMRMREVPALELAPGAVVKMHPGDGYHLMLFGLKKPLKDGDDFPLTLEFEHAGKTEVKVVVQTPKARAAMSDMGEHKH